MAADPSHLAQLARLVEARLGLNLNRGGLSEALRAYAERSLEALDVVRTGDEHCAAFQRLVEAVTVQHSWLFRDLQQLEVACSTLRSDPQVPRVHRVWVPACATGEDAYSIAALCDATGLSFDLLGSDVNAGAIESARRADYGPSATRSVPPPHQAMLTSDGPARTVIPRIRQRVRFTVHNLLDPPPRSDEPGGKWDLVVCRNVLIYLSRTYAARALGHLREALAPGAKLVLGASDILAEMPAGLAPREIGGRVVFERVDSGEAPRRAAPAVRPQQSAGRRPGPPAEQVAAGPRNLPASSSAPSGQVRGVASEGAAKDAPGTSLDGRSVISPATLAQSEEGDVEEAISQLLDGIACHLSGDLQCAVTKLRASLFLMPELWPAAYYLGLTYDGLGRHEEARRAYADATRSIERGRPLPAVAGQDFSFLQRDVAEVARRRARGV